MVETVTDYLERVTRRLTAPAAIYLGPNSHGGTGYASNDEVLLALHWLWAKYPQADYVYDPETKTAHPDGA